MFGAELGLLLFQFAAAGVYLLQERRRKIAAFGLQMRSDAITSSGSPCEAALYSASRRMRSVVTAANCRPNSSISSKVVLC